MPPSPQPFPRSSTAPSRLLLSSQKLGLIGNNVEGGYLDSANIMNSGMILPLRLDLVASGRARSNSRAIAHETSTINYELFSLKRIISLSTGTYPMNSSDYTIDTSQWEEISMSQSFWNKYIMKEKKTNDIDFDKQSSSGDSIGNGQGLDMSVILANTQSGIGDESFFSNALKTNSMMSPRSGSSKKSQDSSSNYSSPSLSNTNVAKPVTFKSVISGGTNSLYNVIASLCSNNVIVLRFFGTVKYLDRDDEKYKIVKGHDDDEISETESVASIGSTSNDMQNNAHFRYEDEDYSNNKLCSPIVRCLSYFHENGIELETIAMDESARWLSCMTADADVYIVPICRLFFPYNSDNSYPFKKNLDGDEGKGSNQFPSLFDYTLFKLESPLEASQATTVLATEALNLNLMKNIELVITNSSSSIKKHQLIQKYQQQHLSSSQSLLESIERTVVTTNTKTKRQYQPVKHGEVTCSAWWVTFSNHQLKKYYLIYGTDKGFLVFLNLHTLKEDAVVGGFKYGIRSIKIVSDEKSVKFALVTCGKGAHYKQILEQLDLSLQTFRNVCDYYQTQNSVVNVSGNNKDVKREMHNDSEVFKLRRLEQFNNEGSPCYMNVKWFEEKQSHLISCLNKEKNIFSLFDVQTISQIGEQLSRNKRDEAYPLFQYHLGESTSIVHPTNRLLFSLQRGEGVASKRGLLGSPSADDTEYQERLFVMGRSLLLMNNGRKHGGVLQEFLLPTNEMVKGMMSGFLYRDDCTHQEKFKSEHNYEMEGVFFWTQTGIYEIRQKYSPLRIFEYIISNKQNIIKDGNLVDQFGQTFELDLFALYEQYADERFEQEDYDFAFTLYKLSNVSEVKYVNRLLQAERSEEAFKYLLSVLENSSSISLMKRKQLSNLLFECFMQKLISTSEINTEILKQFRQFLLTNTDINPQAVISQLVQYCCCNDIKFSNPQDSSLINMELILEIAHKHNLMKFTLQFLVSRGYISVLSENGGIKYLYDNEYGYLTQSIGCGVLLQHCTANTKAKFLLEYLEQMRMIRLKTFMNETIQREPSDDFFSMDFKSRKQQVKQDVTSQQANSSPIKQQLFFEDSLEAIQYNSKLFDMLINLLPHIDDISILTTICNRFNPEENANISKETRQSASSLVREPTYARYFHYPYIHLEQHLEIFIVAMLCLVRLKRKLTDTFVDNHTSSTTGYLVTNLTSNSLYSHTQEKLEQCVKCYNMYRKQFIVSCCLKFNNKSVLALIYEKDEMWIDALCCKLVQIKENYSEYMKHTKDNDNATSIIDNTLKYYFTIFDRYLTNKTNDLDEESKLKILEKLFTFYYNMQFPTSKLEEHCIKNIHVIGDILSILLLLQNTSSVNSQALKKNLKFSHNFYLKITQSYVRNVKRNERDEERSIRNLTQQILRNMEKDIYKRNHITVSNSDIAKLSQQSQDDRIVVFTCGDHYTRSNFTSNILIDFKNRVNQLVLAMPSETNKSIVNTATEIILKDYQNMIEERSLHTNQACPVCVYNFFLKNEKAKILKLKPQTTRMLHQQPIVNNTPPLSDQALQYLNYIEKLPSWSLLK
ncbi:hypothetical protein C9374_013316 [Naegleria lovaniensis]|uniref:Uncharacterized protein n=1 Tax=Naegleria lovaniensis TaxID=51637 RepID=A0AA88H0B9_NAELO|nr:uncharacterized protein C9374_013316 [Naegleria lovaniensis]KAG2391831.1 hypothetical protein C9374_013316 [Naegleria lovaniensis]